MVLTTRRFCTACGRTTVHIIEREEDGTEVSFCCPCEQAKDQMFLPPLPDTDDADEIQPAPKE